MKLEGNSSKDDDANGILLQPRKSSAVQLQIAPMQPKTITHLPKRPPVDLAFTDLTYTVREGRKNSECFHISFYFNSFIGAELIYLFMYLNSNLLNNCVTLLDISITFTK